MAEDLKFGAQVFCWGNFSTLFAYSNLGHPGNKIVDFLRPVFSATIAPAYEITARYDFDLTEIIVGPVLPEDQQGKWDIGIWDQAVWGGGRAGGDNPRGASGMGRYVAAALRGSSTGETSLLAVSTIFTPGWFL